MAAEKLQSAILDDVHPSGIASHIQKRSNSVPITASSLSERLSALRNTLSPSGITVTKVSGNVPTLQLSPALGLSNKNNDFVSVNDFQESGSSSGSGSGSSSDYSPSHKVGGIQKLLKNFSLTSLAESNNNGVKSKVETNTSYTNTDQVTEKSMSLESIESKLREQRNIIPPEFIDPGIELLRITHRKKVKRCFQVDTESNIMKWNNKSSSFLRIDKIKNIRTGEDAKNYREEFKISSEYKDLWITIIYFNDSISNNIKALHVLATRKYEYDIFVNTLRLLVFVNRDLAKNISLGLDSELFTNFHWNNYVMNENKFNERIIDTPQTMVSQTLDSEGVLKLTKRLNINIDRNYLLALFQKCDVDSNGFLDFEEFKNFVSMLRTRLEINDIFHTITQQAERMYFEQFQDFLIETQKEDYDSSFIWKLFNKFSSHGVYLSVEDFQNFLKSSYTSPIIQVEEDFSEPINNYYISSSHNTYLLGRQFGGESSVEGYIRALQRGCRCIEIDLWDGQLENGEKGPIVKHGRSFTTSVSLKDVLQVIKKYAFIFTPFPLIISLEVHCNSENQIIIKNLLCNILGEMLVLEPIMTNSFLLPSPKELKHKVLIKVKKTDVAGSSSTSFSNSTSTSTSTTTSGSSISEDSLSKSTSKESFITRAKGSTKINPELASLGVYMSAIKFRNFSLPESKIVNHVFSFSEKAINKMTKDPVKLQSLEKHNKRYLMRMYPSKYRYNSTNFNPIQYWALGIQMVATNWQMFDLGQQLNESMFLCGSQSGYVLKPMELRKFSKKGEDWKPKSRTRVNLSIDIISAQQLPTPKDYNGTTNPFIEFEIYGYDSIKYVNDVNKTNIVRANGFNPIWQESFQREIITTTPSLVFIRLLVKCATDNDTSLLVGVCVLKLTSLKKGYRHLTVYDLQGEEFIFSKLFVKIDYEELAI